MTANGFQPDGHESAPDDAGLRELEVLLEAYDEALQFETPASALSTQPEGATIDHRLAGAQQCLRLLHRRWPHPASAEHPQHPDSADASAGKSQRTFGRFLIERQLGRGGFGIVYLAFDPVLQRHIALKLPRPDVLAGSDAHRRFIREGQTAARLHHPNLVTVLEAGEVGPVCYLATEYCAGPTLSAWLKSQERPLPPALAARIILNLADAVGYLHDQQIIHRDIKPGNVLLSPRTTTNLPNNGTDNFPYEPKLTDFGLARSPHGESLQTRTGATLGTPAYMAPEQAGGANQAAGPSADVYSLGVLLYDFLTGHNPFAAPTDLETFRRHLDLDPPGLRHHHRTIPRDLESICLKCLEKSPARRYASGRELADELRRYVDGTPIRARRTNVVERVQRMCRKRPVVAGLMAIGALAGALCLLGLFLVTLAWNNAAIVRTNSRLRETLEQASQLQQQVAEQEDKALEAEYVSRMQSVYAAWQRGESEAAAHHFIAYPATSPRHDFLGFEYRYFKRQFDAEVICLRMQRRGGSDDCHFSADGKKFAATTGGSDVLIWDVGDWTRPKTWTRPQTLFTDLRFVPNQNLLIAKGLPKNNRTGPFDIIAWDYSTDREVGHWQVPYSHGISLAVSPDGRRIASGGVGTSTGKRLASACILDLESGQMDMPETEGSYVRSLAFSSDGNTLACGVSLPSYDRADTIWFYDIKASSTIERPSEAHRKECFSMTSCGDGKTLLTSGVHGEVFLWDWSTRRIRSRLQVADEQRKTAAAISASGEMIFGGQMGPFTHDDFPPIVAISSAAQRPVADLGMVFWGTHILACSPDGRWLAGVSGLDVNHRRLQVWDTTRRHRVRWLAGHGAAECWAVAFMPDGETLLSSGDDHFVRAWDIRDETERQPVEAHTSLVSCVAADPRGRHWASGSYDQTVKLWNAKTGELVRTIRGHTGSVRCLAFSPDGQRLAAGDKDQKLCIWEVSTGALLSSWQQSGDQVRAVAYSPDGRWLAAGSADRSVTILATDAADSSRRFLANDVVTSLAFTPDGKQLLVGTEAGTVSVVDAVTMSNVQTLHADSDQILAIAISPDGATVTAGGTGRVVYVWHRRSGTELLRFTDLAGQVNGLAFDPAGDRLVAALHDGSIAIWDALPKVAAAGANIGQ